MNDDCLTLGIDHLGLSVSKLDETVSFFVQGLGWEEVGRKPNYPAVFVSDGNITLTLWQTVAYKPVKFDRKNNVGLHHLALKLATEADLNKLFERVKNWPMVLVEFSPEFSGAGPKVHFMINEPSGNRIEFAFDPR